MSQSNRARVVVSLALSIAAVGACLLWTALAAGQPASAPTSQPAEASWWTNPATAYLIASLLVAVLPTIITAVTKYAPKATGLVAALKIALDVLSFWGHKDSPTGLSWPGKRSAPPRE